MAVSDLDRLLATRSPARSFVQLGGSVPATRDLRLVPIADLSPAAVDLAAASSTSDIVAVLYTSGTTGPAKGVMMSSRHVMGIARQSVSALRLTEDDVFLVDHPLFHIAGKFMAVLGAMLVGGRVIVERRFDPGSWLGMVRAHGATVTIAHGPMIEQVYAMPGDLDDADNTLRALVACPLPASIGPAFEARYAVRAIEVWGMSEVGVPVWCDYDEALVPGSCGRVMSDEVEVVIADPETDERLPAGAAGEILVRPRRPWTTFQGYLSNAEASTQAWRNLWFHTGDFARIDDDGRMWFLGRAAERIRRRGENISAHEIETAALTMPGVVDAAVVGVASGYDSDDEIMLCVVTAQDLAPEEMIKHLARRVPHYMVPRYVRTLAELPRTPTSKVQKGVLRASGVTRDTWDRQASGASLRDIVDALDAQSTSVS